MIAKPRHHKAPVTILWHTVVLCVQALPFARVTKLFEFLNPLCKVLNIVCADNIGDIFHKKYLREITVALIKYSLYFPQQTTSCSATFCHSCTVASLAQILTRKRICHYICIFVRVGYFKVFCVGIANTHKVVGSNDVVIHCAHLLLTHSLDLLSCHRCVVVSRYAFCKQHLDEFVYRIRF